MALHSVSRAPDGIWLDRRRVTRSVAGSYSASELRGSSGVGARRWLTRSSETTCAAVAKAASVAAGSPWRISAAMLPVAASHTSGAPAAVASWRSVTTASVSKSMVMVSMASRACSSVSANTATTASPTKRTRSWARAGRSGLAAGAPSGRLKFGASGNGLTPSATRSAPVSTATTPGRASAAAVSMETMRAWACGERRMHRCTWPGMMTSSLKRPAPASRPRSSIRFTSRPLPKRPMADMSFMWFSVRKGGQA